MGGGPGRTNRAGQSPADGTDPLERNHRAKSRTASPPKVAPPGPRGARHGWRDRLPPEHPDPSLWAGPGKAGLKRGRSQAELGPRRLPRTLPAGAGGAGPAVALGAAPPRPGRCPGGGPADRPRVSRECTGRADPSKRPQCAVVPVRPARGQVPAGSSPAGAGRDGARRHPVTRRQNQAEETAKSRDNQAPEIPQARA